MWMPVHEAGMVVQVGVRLARRIVGRVRVLVMFIVHVPVAVAYWFVHMVVIVAFGEVQP